MAAPAVLILFGGPAGAGKSTLARAWCQSRKQAVHIELDSIQSLIVAGLADPQLPGPVQTKQYELSLSACCVLARLYLHAGYDVAIDAVFEPDAFENYWRPALRDLSFQILVVQPSLEETLKRAANRKKDVRPDIIRAQDEAMTGWPDEVRVDTTGLTLDESLSLCRKRGLLP